MTDAFAASFLAMGRARGVSEGIFLTGMLHNIGKSLGLRSFAALILAGQIEGLPDAEAMEALLRQTRVGIGEAALTSLGVPGRLLQLCRRRDDDDFPVSTEWTDLHIVSLVSALNGLRMATVQTETPLR